MAAALGGHAPTSVLIAAWEDRFPWPTWEPELGNLDGQLLVGPGAPRSPSPYPTLTGAWASRLEAACRRHDRTVDRRGAGLVTVVRDVYGWGGVEVAQHGAHWSADPAAPAFFVARLVARSKRLQRAHRDPYTPASSKRPC